MKNRFNNDPGLMDYTQAVDKCEPDDLKNDFFPEEETCCRKVHRL